MPDFSVRVSSGAEVGVWEDPETDDAPTRIRPLAGLPHRRLIIGGDDPIVPVVVQCTPDGGAEAPLDAELGGRAFMWWWIEAPPTTPALYHSMIRSSKIRFKPAAPGHYTLEVYRPRGGFVILHFDKLP